VNAANKLRWRCRRGTRELDVMLLRYLDQHHASADAAEQATFLRLLDLDDTDLLRYLLGESPPEAPDLARLVSVIRGLSHR